MHCLTKIIRNINYSRYKSQIHLFGNSVKTIKNHASFHFTGKINIKMFLEYENKYAYSIMEKEGYVLSLLLADKSDDSLTQSQFDRILQENLTKKSPQELFHMFTDLGTFCSKHNLSITHSMFDNFIDHLTDNINVASDKELQSLFYVLNKWPETASIRSRNYIEIWTALDDECLKRLPEWSFDKLLSFISLFYMLNITKGCEFSMKAIQKLASKAKKLTPAQLVQTIFFVGILRKSPFDMHNLEIQLEEHFSAFNIDELAIISMGFFKSKTPIRSFELTSKIMDKLIENSKDIHEVSLSALLKIIRYSMKTTLDDRIYVILNSLEQEVPRLSLMCCVHIALLGSATLTVHEKCLDRIAGKVCDSIKKARLKDLERLILTYGTLNYIPQTNKKIFQTIIEELRNPEREAEIGRHGRSYALSVSFLTLVGLYPIDLFSKVLDPAFLQRTYGRHPLIYGREVLTIHNTVNIFCSNSNINGLSDKAAIVMAKKYTDYVPDENYKKQFNVSEKMIIDVVNILKELRGGPDYVIADHILTHHQRGDVIICNNKDGSPTPFVVNNKLPSEFGLIRKPPNDNTWIVLVISGRNSIIKNKNIPAGPIRQKLNELRKIGYKAGFVDWNTWFGLQNKEEKELYLCKVIDEALNV